MVLSSSARPVRSAARRLAQLPGAVHDATGVLAAAVLSHVRVVERRAGPALSPSEQHALRDAAAAMRQALAAATEALTLAAHSAADEAGELLRPVPAPTATPAPVPAQVAAPATTPTTASTPTAAPAPAQVTARAPATAPATVTTPTQVTTRAPVPAQATAPTPATTPATAPIRASTPATTPVPAPATDPATARATTSAAASARATTPAAAPATTQATNPVPAPATTPATDPAAAPAPAPEWQALERLTSAQRRALHYYTTVEGAGELNAYLRHHTDVPKKRRAALWQLVDDAVAGVAALPRFTGLAYRGTSLPAAQLRRWRPGVVVADRGFASASASRSVADAFRGGGNAFITVVGHSGADIRALSSFPHEAEVLYPPGTRFRVVDRSWDHRRECWSFLIEEVTSCASTAPSTTS
ncbi:ADP-ribosyltransferase domain-containing protein [Jiangella sp. DSM 45060]|uniref:ADP-ribosyltransferase domain-containing protein n=1 Tax=Jiangella sp. DSM 45060 TaxID=1798224 RepID=UPI00087C9A2E|nr:ADP-ribosyltransferase domain-containing protein [Jiangella sp. DSM 45060]SDS00988.1 NAD:arginine ADP-ribosyltransferase [Jiangella sp. DSM 45060]